MKKFKSAHAAVQHLLPVTPYVPAGGAVVKAAGGWEGFGCSGTDEGASAGRVSKAPGCGCGRNWPGSCTGAGIFEGPGTEEEAAIAGASGAAVEAAVSMGGGAGGAGGAT